MRVYAETDLTLEHAKRRSEIVREGRTRDVQCVAVMWTGVDSAIRCIHQARWTRSGKYPVCGNHGNGLDVAYIPEAAWFIAQPTHKELLP